MGKIILAFGADFWAQLAAIGAKHAPVRPLKLFFAALILALLPVASFAQAVGPVSGFPLPRFASLRDQPINVRLGPGTRYDIAWVFVRAELPVEIIQEFDTWRKIRDLDGQTGWIHQNLLIGRRTGYVAPWDENAQIALRSGRASDAGVRAWLGSNLLVGIDDCDGQVCKINTKPTPSHGTYSGYIAQEALWGVYAGEDFD